MTPDNKPAEATKPMLELKMLLVGPGVMISNNVGISDVSIKDLMSYPSTHPELVKAAQVGVTVMTQQYNGIQPSSDPEGQHKADLAAHLEKAA